MLPLLGSLVEDNLPMVRCFYLTRPSVTTVRSESTEYWRRCRSVVTVLMNGEVSSGPVGVDDHSRDFIPETG